MLTRPYSQQDFFVKLTHVVFSLLSGLILLRFIFRLFAANSTAPFVAWLYETTDILMSPFRGIFQTQVIDGRFVFDITALVALVIYALIFSFILYLFDWMGAREVPVVPPRK